MNLFSLKARRDRTLDKPIEGKNLTACFEVASAACLEVEQLIKLLTNVLVKNLEKNKIRTHEPKRCYQHDKSTWIYTDVAQSIGITFSRKKKINKYLGFQISLMGEGLMGCKEPLIHFFYWDCAVDFNESWITSPFNFDQEFKIKDKHLVSWSDEDSNEWMFSIRLVAINSESDIVRIIEAIIDLINDSNLISISELLGIIGYHIEDGNLKY